LVVTEEYKVVRARIEVGVGVKGGTHVERGIIAAAAVGARYVVVVVVAVALIFVGGATRRRGVFDPRTARSGCQWPDDLFLRGDADERERVRCDGRVRHL
jgi:hypothetical protein